MFHSSKSFTNRQSVISALWELTERITFVDSAGFGPRRDADGKVIPGVYACWATVYSVKDLMTLVEIQTKWGGV